MKKFLESSIKVEVKKKQSCAGWNQTFHDHPHAYPDLDSRNRADAPVATKLIPLKAGEYFAALPVWGLFRVEMPPAAAVD